MSKWKCLAAYKYNCRSNIWAKVEKQTTQRTSYERTLNWAVRGILFVNPFFTCKFTFLNKINWRSYFGGLKFDFDSTISYNCQYLVKKVDIPWRRWPGNFDSPLSVELQNEIWKRLDLVIRRAYILPLLQLRELSSYLNFFFPNIVHILTQIRVNNLMTPKPIFAWKWAEQFQAEFQRGKRGEVYVGESQSHHITQRMRPPLRIWRDPSTICGSH